MIGMRALLLLSAALLGNPVAAGEIEELQARANQGDAVSQAELGLRFAEGDGVEQEFGQAFHWWTLAANQGDALAQRNLGVMYAQGDHVAQDYTRAVYWYTLAANQGSVRAQFDLGVMYREGAGIRQDNAQAANWFTLAANGGSVAAQYYLGVMYTKGAGVAHDVGSLDPLVAHGRVRRAGPDGPSGRSTNTGRDVGPGGEAEGRAAETDRSTGCCDHGRLPRRRCSVSAHGSTPFRPAGVEHPP